MRAFMSNGRVEQLSSVGEVVELRSAVMLPVTST